MVKKVAVLLVEGDTEVAFYKRVINNLRSKMNADVTFTIKVLNTHGIGGFCEKAIRKINVEIKPQFPDYKITLFFCYDTDSFEYSKRPPVNWKSVEKVLKADGIRCYHIRAKQSIESWFLKDKESVCRYLRIPVTSKLVGRSDYDKLTALFKKGNRVYIKGKNKKAEEFINCLDIIKIMDQICDHLKPLCKCCGVVCDEKKRYCEES